MNLKEEELCFLGLSSTKDIDVELKLYNQSQGWNQGFRDGK